MHEHTIADLLTETRRLRRRFTSTAPRQWDTATAGAELTVQLGHLALCLLRRRGAEVTTFEDPQRPISHLGDELADVVLAGLSITVLADSRPTPYSRIDLTAADEVEALLRLLVTAGWLAEAGLVSQRYRHRPTGSPPPVAVASTALLDACETLATQLGVDLPTEFRAMVSSADRFLDDRSAPR